MPKSAILNLVVPSNPWRVPPHGSAPPPMATAFIETSFVTPRSVRSPTMVALPSPVGVTDLLTNDAFGYILTKVDFHSFPRYDYVSRVSLGEMTGETLIDYALKLIATADQAQ